MKKANKKFGILIICTAILALSFVGPASATNWSVDGSGGADFAGIQEAINNASAGDTIFVHSGVYRENVVVNKPVTLKGIGNPIVNASGSGDTITLLADAITLVGFNVTTSGSSWKDAGIKVTSCNNIIVNNNVSNKLDGIGLSSSCNNNTITGNNACNNWYGIVLRDSSNNTITGNNVCNNNDGGIVLSSSCNNIITGNNASNNDRGIDLSSSCKNSITDNTFVT